MLRAFIAAHGTEILNIAGSLLLSLLGLATYHLTAWIKAHTRNARVQGVLLRLNDAVFTAVESVEQVVVAAMKSSGDPLTLNGATIAKNAALVAIKTHLGPRGIAEVRDILGISSGDFDSFLGARIEARVLRMPEKFASPQASAK